MRHHYMGRSPLLVFARILGVGAALATVLLYGALLFANPYRPHGITTGTYWIAALMIGFALVAAWGAVRLKASLLLVAFVGSFMPVGFYLWGTSGIFSLIGFANLLYALAGIIIFLRQQTSA